MWSWSGECRGECMGEWECEPAGVGVGMCVHPGMRCLCVTAVYSCTRALFNFSNEGTVILARSTEGLVFVISWFRVCLKRLVTVS